MKQKDIAILIAVAFFSAVVSLLLSNMFFATPKDRAQEVETIDAITADFPTPNKEYFNTESVNPSKLVEIGSNNNQNPFGN
jgi:hypothetical protein